MVGVGDTLGTQYLIDPFAAVSPTLWNSHTSLDNKMLDGSAIYVVFWMSVSCTMVSTVIQL